MSFTPPRASRKTWTRRSADLGLALLAGALPLLGGCAAPPGVVHPGYSAHAPRTVTVLPVKNETLHQLDAVAFGGLLQRATIGVETHDIPELLRGSLEETLFRKGFETPGAAAPDASLQATIEAWESEAAGRFGMYLRYRLEMRHASSGEVLYSGTFSCQEQSDVRSGSDDELVPTIRRSAARALSVLPARPR